MKKIIVSSSLHLQNNFISLQTLIQSHAAGSLSDECVDFISVQSFLIRQVPSSRRKISKETSSHEPRHEKRALTPSIESRGKS